MLLECKNVYKTFGKKEILHDVTFGIDEGDVLAFIGPNGSGKTTTIKLMLGLQSITKGSIFIEGNNVESDFVEAIKNVGAIVENPDFYMYMSGYDNLLLCARMYPNVDESRVKEVVKMVKLENRIHDKVSKYSLGMRQRLGIAQAILHHPKLLILDEPTNGLDPEGIKELRELIASLAKKEKMGIFISSHALLELETFCNKVCIIKNGAIIETTSVKKLKNDIVNVYSISCSDLEKANQIIEGTIIDDHIALEIDREEIPKVIKKLVKANIDVFEVKLQDISLEDAFLNKVGGNIID